MKGASAGSRKSRPDAETSLPWRQARVQHDNRVRFPVFVIPNLVRDLGLGFNAPPCGRGSLFIFSRSFPAFGGVRLVLSEIEGMKGRENSPTLYLSTSGKTTSRLPKIATRSAIFQPLQSLGKTVRLQNEPVLILTRYGLVVPSVII
jgi:hypothetical protein